MTVNNNSVEQINVALLEVEKKLSALREYTKLVDELTKTVNLIKANLNETKAGLNSGGTYDINITGNAATATNANYAIRASVADSADVANSATRADFATSANVASIADNAGSATNDGDGNEIATTYQKVSEKDSVAGYVRCDQTANGVYSLEAEVLDGTVTYRWI